MHPIRIYQPSPTELAVTWQGGSESRIATRQLRLACPCSDCASALHSSSATYIPLLTEAAGTIRELDLVGSSALHVVWGDGHAKSIFRFSLLRELAPPEEPAAA